MAKNQKSSVNSKFYRLIKQFKPAVCFILSICMVFIIFIKIDWIILWGRYLAAPAPIITYTDGTAEYKIQNSDEWKPAETGLKLGSGMILRTGKGSKIDIRLQGRTAARLDENTEISVSCLTVKNLEVFLLSGKFYGHFKKLSKIQDIGISSPVSSCVVRGTDLGFEFSGKKISIYALSGRVEIKNPELPEKKVSLGNCTVTVIAPGDEPSQPDNMTRHDIERIREIINSININKVLFVSYNINFAALSTKLTDDSFQELDKITELLKKKAYKICIAGHSDKLGSEVNNLELSEKRAHVIRDYLVSRGIPAASLSVRGFGETRPLADNSTVSGRKKNRRVEFLIID